MMKTPKTAVSMGRRNWRWQEQRAVRMPEALPTIARLTPARRHAAARQPFKATPYYLSLCRPSDARDPLWRMIAPDPRELQFAPDESDDPLRECRRYAPVPALVHRHRERVLLFPAWRCAGHCRFCFRRLRIGGAGDRLADLRPALAYIARHREIREVILTGGDPLMLPDRELFGLLARLRRFSHIRLLRIHTRVPAYNPFRLTRTLCAGLHAARPLWVVTHFNHPREISAVAERYLQRLQTSVPVLNQSVLLRGVNDNLKTLAALCWRLGAIGIKPYYLHQLDRACGTSHWRVGVERGKNLIAALRRVMPGYLVPQYVMDVPDSDGKTPLVSDGFCSSGPYHAPYA